MKFSGLLLGYRLPKNEIKIGDFTIKKVTEEEAHEMFLRLSPVGATANLQSPGYNIDPSVKKVFSHHLIEVEVKAESRKKAKEIVSKKLDKLLMSLTVYANNERYHVRMVEPPETSVDEDGIQWIDSPTSFYPIEHYHSSKYFPVQLQDEKYFLAVEEAYQCDDKVLKRCSNYLNRAWMYMDISGYPKLSVSILTSYFLVIESIADAVSKDYRKGNEENYQEKKVELINKFCREKDSVNDMLSLYSEINSKIAKLDHKILKERIKLTCEIFNMDDTLKNLALELYDQRNELSHPRTKIKLDSKWLSSKGNFEPNLTDHIYRIFIKCYLNHLKKKKK